MKHKARKSNATPAVTLKLLPTTLAVSLTLGTSLCHALPAERELSQTLQKSAAVRQVRSPAHSSKQYHLGIVALGPAGLARPVESIPPVASEDFDLSISSAAQRSGEIVFVDRAVPDYETLLPHIDSQVEVVILEGGSDGLEQMARALQGRRDLRAIHVLSHGAPGQLLLGDRELSYNNLVDSREALRDIGNSLRPDGDMLLYGCNVAQGNRGRIFLKALSRLTGVDVAASDDATGSADRDGDWELEIASGNINAVPLLSAAKTQAYQGLLSLPTLGGTFTTAGSVLDNATTTPFSSVTVSDADNDNVSVNITFTGANGTLSGTGLTYNSSGDYTLDSVAPATAQSRLQALVFTPTANQVASGSTVVTSFTLTPNDGTGDGTSDSTTQITATSVNNEPTLTATGSDPTFTEGGSAAGLFSSTSISTVEPSENITQLVFTVTNVNDSTSETINIDGTSVVLTNGTSGTTAANSYGYSVSVAGSTATVTLSKTDTVANWQTLVDNLSYSNTSQNPDTSSRVVTITSLKDSGGTANSGDDTNSTLAVASTVTVAAVNDDPAISGLPTDVTVTEDTASNVDLSSATLSDVDAGSGSITLAIAAGAGTLGASSGGGVTVSGSGTATLTLSGTVSNIDTFLDTASNIQYTGASNVNGNDVTTLTLTANDGGNSGSGGGGNVSLGTVNVDITAQNDAPVNTVAPAISGTALIGGILSATSGTWTDADGDMPTYTYQWYRADDNSDTNLAAISGATSSSYTLTTSEAHKYVRVVVTADDGNGSNDQTATSSYTAVDNSAPSNALSPVISGTAAVGNILSASTGTWADADGDSISYSYQWYRADDNIDTNLAAISGATSNSYTLTSSEAHKYVRVVVTVDDGNGSSDQTATSSYSAIGNSVPANSVAPTISGTAAVGNALSANTGTWSDDDGDSLSYSYQWYRADDNSDTNLAAISGATSSSYTLTTSEAHKYLRVVVTVDDGNGSSDQTATSAYTAIGNSAPSNSVLPVISGTAAVGNTLSATTGTWSDADNDSLSYSYQWKADGSNISGAATSSYTLTSAEAHKAITVTVTASDGNGGSTAATSAASTVSNSAPVFTGTPSIAGTAAISNALTAADTATTDSDGDTVTLSYQWKADGSAISGATAASYTLTAAEAHKTITLTVTGDDGNSGTVTATTAGVSVANTAPANSALPVISGTATVGNALTATTGTWTDADGDSLTYSYQWKAGGNAIGGATASSYTLTSAEAHKTITLTVTGDDGNSGTVTATTAGVSVTNTVPEITSSAVTAVDEDAAYSYTFAASDADADTLTYSAPQLPSWLSFNASTGVLSGTPVNSNVGSHNVTLRVNDGTVDVEQSFSITVANTNDAPEISGTPATRVVIDQAYSFTPTASDEDTGDSLSYVIANKPAWAAFDTATGSLSGTPAAADVGSATGIVIGVNDGTTTTNLAAFTITVVGDLDGDTVGDDVDPDIDGDGMDNDFENQYGLDPYDPADADMDSDGDGLSNLEEFNKGLDPTTDDNPPVVTAPADVLANATGLYTWLALGEASATDALDGELSATSDSDGYFAPGLHTVTWSARDAAGNVGTAEQTVEVLPLVQFAKDQYADEGVAVTVRLFLNGPSPRYPVQVPFTVAGTATQPDDYSLADGTAIFTEGTETTLTVNTVDDGQSGESLETIDITIGTPVNAVAGPHDSHVITITEANIAPRVELHAEQQTVTSNVVTVDNGPVTVYAVVTDSNPSDNHSFDWSGSDNNLIDTDTAEDSFTFNPVDLTPGLYTLNITVSDDGEPARHGSTQLSLRVIASAPVLSGDADSDGDGVDDASEGYGDADNDGVADYLDAVAAPNVLQENAATNDKFLIETEPGLKLGLGYVAFAAGNNSAQVTEADIAAHFIGAFENDTVENVGGLFDFEVSELPQSGQSLQVVLPQQQAVPENALYRKLTSAGWVDFVDDERNQVASALGEAGYCPPPGDDAYTEGLTAGDWCVQLTIEDGGPNDADGEINNAVSDPGGVGRMPLTSVEVNGSGAFGLPALFVILLAWLSGRRFKIGRKP